MQKSKMQWLGQKSVAGRKKSSQAVSYLAVTATLLATSALVMAEPASLERKVEDCTCPPINSTARSHTRKCSAKGWITVTALPGPSDYVYDPLKGDVYSDSKSSRTLHSILFIISVNPSHELRSNEKKDAVKNFDQDLTNLLLDITLKEELSSQKTNPSTPSKTSKIRVVSILPHQTLASTQDGGLGTLGRVAGTIFDGITGARTGYTQKITQKVGEKIDDVTEDTTQETTTPRTDISYKGSGLGGALADIVSPRSVPMQYGFIKNNNSFGWRLRQYTRVPQGASLLGIRTGLVVYEIEGNDSEVKEIEGVRVQWNALARWRENFEDKTNWVESTNDEQVIPIKIKTKNEIETQREEARTKELKNLSSLDGLPALIPIDDVEKILHISSDFQESFRKNPNGYLQTTATNALQVIEPARSCNETENNSKKLITRHSLERFLGLEKLHKRVGVIYKETASD